MHAWNWWRQRQPIIRHEFAWKQESSLCRHGVWVPSSRQAKKLETPKRKSWLDRVRDALFGWRFSHGAIYRQKSGSVFWLARVWPFECHPVRSRCQAGNTKNIQLWLLLLQNGATTFQSLWACKEIWLTTDTRLSISGKQSTWHDQPCGLRLRREAESQTI